MHIKRLGVRMYIFLLVVTVAPLGNGQTVPAPADLLIDQIKKTVVYLQGIFPCHEPRIVNGVTAIGPDGKPIFETTCSESGTGFLVNYPLPEFGPGVGMPLLVTSKHLIRHQKVDAPFGQEEYFGTITAIANTKTPNGDGSFISPVPVLVKDRGYLFCSIDNRDLDADIAVCPIAISEDSYDFKTIDKEMLVTASLIQSERLNENDEVLFSGLFLPYHGAKKNYPIVRHGKIALIPKEKIPWGDEQGKTSLQDLYLAEVTSWGGNSGSPVFARLAGAREQGNLMVGIRYLLLGVMQGYFNADRPAGLDTSLVTDTAHLNVKLSDNSGVAAVVPAEKILDIFDQPRIKAQAALVRAGAYIKAGKNNEAEASFKESISILREVDPSHPLLKEALSEYAIYLQSVGRYTEGKFQARLAASINKVITSADDDLR